RHRTHHRRHVPPDPRRYAQAGRALQLSTHRDGLRRDGDHRPRGHRRRPRRVRRPRAGARRRIRRAATGHRRAAAPRAGSLRDALLTAPAPGRFPAAAAVVTLAAYGIYAALAPHQAVDLWMAMACGRTIVADHGLPAGDVFSWTYAGAPWFNGE